MEQSQEMLEEVGKIGLECEIIRQHEADDIYRRSQSYQAVDMLGCLEEL